ncbi:aldo/keto reductase [Aureimonas fodinaquatilis]|uniref:Aldo/keto reductase n=1 Tax=Aureimonas fodinaquatilis TaxID=2565783 RepID=A0A5B0DXE9_9HYPH|nr:aldo/keto reductase [Aureimonas fodinaquatilis]KAA0970421.1 aldo/keto reductase [Aureimonas fodinaquatilis]
MQTRKLGSSLTVPSIGLGCMGMSGTYGVVDADEAAATLRHAIDIGVTFLDTADSYGSGQNESFIGEVIKGHREKLVIATKFGSVRYADGGRGVCGTPDYVRSACEASLKRLGTDHVDLYYQHRVDATVPIEETVGAMAELVAQGKVRYLGLSEAGAATIRRAHAVHPIAALQTEYSLWSRDIETNIIPTLRELGIGLVPYSPLGRGFLAGNVAAAAELEEGDSRRNYPRFAAENYDQNLALANTVRQLAQTRGVTAGQMALAWVLAQGHDVVPIPGTKRRKYLDENAAAASIALTEDELATMSKAFKPDAVAGARYPEALLKATGI